MQAYVDEETEEIPEVMKCYTGIIQFYCPMELTSAVRLLEFEGYPMIPYS